MDRGYRKDLRVKAEIAIDDAITEVELLGGELRLDIIKTKLEEARKRLTEYINSELKGALKK